MILFNLILTIGLNLASPHDIASLDSWGPYSKQYNGIAHIDDLQSGRMVEFTLIPGIYRRECLVPNSLFACGVYPWKVSADMKHICYRYELEWKDRVYVDATYHIMDKSHVLVEMKCVNSTDAPANLNLQLACSATGVGKESIRPSLSKGDGEYIAKYKEIGSWYGVAWDYPYSEVREFRNSTLDILMRRKIHDHVHNVFPGDNAGHYTCSFLRPVDVAPRSDTTLWHMIVCGTKDSVRKEMDLFHADPLKYTTSAGDISSECLPSGEKYLLGWQLLQATLLTNVVYPIDAFGKPIRHFTPGKNWNSLYTWDCGFIGWGMGTVCPSRGYEIIRQYTTTPDEKAPFVHHGTPLAIQIFAIDDIWARLGSDEGLLKEIYPRLKRFYDYMTGPECRLPSGLISTWHLFYNSGGWDDYSPQKYLSSHTEERKHITSMVEVSYYIRCAKILRLAASHMGLKEDVKQFDADIKAMSAGVLDNAWDEQCGYFGYIRHDSEGNAKEIFRTSEGVNFNMGIDGITPMVAGIGTEAQTERMLDNVFSPKHLWSSCGISAVDQSAPYYTIDGYWNGTVWMPHQFILWKTMLDLGRPDLARQIADKALGKWEEECELSYQCYEHFMIRSGRGGGWHNFSGLSSPVLNWFASYYRSGNVSTGFNVLLTSSVFSEDNSSYKATMEFDKDAVGKATSILVCLKPGKHYKAAVNGKPVDMESPYDGLVQITLKATKKPLTLEIM